MRKSNASAIETCRGGCICLRVAKNYLFLEENLDNQRYNLIQKIQVTNILWVKKHFGLHSDDLNLIVLLLLIKKLLIHFFNSD